MNMSAVSYAPELLYHVVYYMWVVGLRLWRRAIIFYGQIPSCLYSLSPRASDIDALQAQRGLEFNTVLVDSAV